MRTVDAPASTVFAVEGLVHTVASGRRLIDGVTVHFGRGRVTGLIGHNGSGCALGRFGTQDRAKVEEAIHLTDTAPFADRLVDTLSGGERQRVWLAMLVAQDADCLLLDEPISALDIAHQIEVLTLMRRLSEERRLSVVVVLHDINMAARFCDDLVALHGGRLIARGRPDEIVNSDQLAAIYGISMGVIPHPTRGVPICYVE